MTAPCVEAVVQGQPCVAACMSMIGAVAFALFIWWLYRDVKRKRRLREFSGFEWGTVWMVPAALLILGTYFFATGACR